MQLQIAAATWRIKTKSDCAFDQVTFELVTVCECDGCAVRVCEELCSVRCIIAFLPSQAAVGARDVIDDVITAGVVVRSLPGCC